MTPRETLSLDQIHLGEPSFWQLPIEEREGAFRRLRRERPLSFHHEVDSPLFPAGPGFWAVSKHPDIIHVSQNPKRFCSGKTATSIADMPQELAEYFGSMINMDDPKHMRLRKLVSGGFTPGHLKKVEQDVENACAEVIDSVIDRGGCDFVTEIAGPFPIRIICNMMGIPRSQHEFVFERTNVILGGSDPEYVADPEKLMPALMQAATDLLELMNDLRQQRLKKPTDDITSILANAEVDGDRVTEQEMGSFFILLVVAGNETTRNAISHGMKALTDFPEQREAWRRDFEAMSFNAVEEIVRWATPVIFMRRTATEDAEVGGQKIREGEKLILFYNSGNRDEEVFENPFELDLRRKPNDHVGFGGFGNHFCLGANLARREIKVMFRELFRRIPDIHTVGEPDRLFSPFINGIKHMRCEFTPGGAVNAA